MDMEVYFPGNKRVHARYKEFVVETDQPVKSGGDNTAPSPFDLFLASIGTCAGIFLLSFLRQRGISTESASIGMKVERDPAVGLVSRIDLELRLPADFPEKYRDAAIRAVEQCTVKRHLANPPAFELHTTLG